MAKTDYDARELADVMRMLDRSAGLQESRGSVPEWLSTHPDPGNRVEGILAEIPTVEGAAQADVVRRDEYIRRLDGMVFGDNPREGFFEGDVFHHPELRFRLTLPREWRHANTKQAVQAVAPDQDAAWMLTLAEGSASQAMSRFANQEGIRMGGTSSQSVNGLPAATAEFAVQTEQGTLHGLVMYVSHGGNTYEILAYAPEQAWGRYDQVLRASLGSFQEERDSRVLSVQPKRVEIVQLPSKMSFEAFMQRYPSTIEPAELAVINGVGTDATLPAGTLVKRVIGGN
jgi:predicted Zn-dependent protease